MEEDIKYLASLFHNCSLDELVECFEIAKQSYALFGQGTEKLDQILMPRLTDQLYRCGVVKGDDSLFRAFSKGHFAVTYYRENPTFIDEIIERYYQ